VSPGFTIIDNDTVIARLPEIDGTALKVVLVLARRAGASGCCWPSVATIGKEAGLKDRAVQGSIRRLIGRGLVSVERTSGRSATYRITPAPPCAPSQSGDAPGCATPPHHDAGAPAPPCAPPPHRDAPKQEPKNKNQEQDQGNKTKRGKAAVLAAIPPELDTEGFKGVWAKWIDYRKTIKKTLAPQSQEAQLKKLATWGEHQAIESIEASISNGWQGLFEPKQNGEQRHGTRNAKPTGPGQRHRSPDYGQAGVF